MRLFTPFGGYTCGFLRLGPFIFSSIECFSDTLLLVSLPLCFDVRNRVIESSLALDEVLGKTLDVCIASQLGFDLLCRLAVRRSGICAEQVRIELTRSCQLLLKDIEY